MSIVITILFLLFQQKNHTFQVALDLFRAPKLNLLNCFKKTEQIPMKSLFYWAGRFLFIAF